MAQARSSRNGKIRIFRANVIEDLLKALIEHVLEGEYCRKQVCHIVG